MPASILRSYKGGENAGSLTSITINNIDTTGGSLLVIKTGAGYRDSGSRLPSSVTWQGGSTTLHDSEIPSGAHAGAAFYYVNTPVTTTTGSVVVTWAASGLGGVVVEVWQNSDTITPVRTASKASNSYTTTPNVNVTNSVSTDIITDILAVRPGDGPNMVITVNSGQTQVQNFVSGTGALDSTFGASTKPGNSGTVNVGWSIGGGLNSRTAMVAVPIVEAPTGISGNNMTLRILES